ncbi:sigma-70 family RNA polymerase sigma factor [Alterisphingorhabdus coralli]|uniref:RNA polymerase sigma factor FliA n=1 Tax=Alterisphingorhabdus coralli TaxID=3071408 RepID=A0AA97F5J4_9SPHN|nr:RNA polymerase sigma factor FliA [Parasphingorhabdus sp. SCSIO 66989]WOE74759.1 RNA polymerase sigma factor FliA [Parasphingorhabdus sp. SCSIO 66989]
MYESPSQSALYSRKPKAITPGELVEQNLPLVRKIAWHVRGMAPGTVDIEDLVQIGMVALVEAANRYEDQGHNFATYAGTRVRGALIDHLRASSNLCRSALTMRKAMRQTADKLAQELGREPTEAEMAEAMGLEPAVYRERADKAQQMQMESMDEVYSEHSMWFADEQESVDETIEKDQLKALLSANLAQLKEREQMILQLHFIEELNLDEIGKVLDITAARVCQIKKAALDTLRKRLTAQMA